MKINKRFRMAAKMATHSKLRSWLTIIGIVIGVASVIIILALSEGLTTQMNANFRGLGSDMVSITPGASRGSGFGGGGGGPPGESGSSSASGSVTLTRIDVQALKSISDIKYIDTRIQGSVKLYYQGNNGTASVTGVDPAIWQYMITDKIGEGRILGPADSNVVVIGYRLANSYFDRAVHANDMITIGGRAFRVVGILENGTGNNIYMPISMAYTVIADKNIGEYDTIVVKVKDGVNVTDTVTKIQTKLDLSRHVAGKKRDYTVSSSQQLQSMVSSMTSTLTMFLTGIAAISLLVGAVGIVNTMFTSVLERTKEIGIMKAIGAKNGDILTIFLFNAGLIGFMGGVIGLGIGYGVCYMLTTWFSVTTTVSPTIAILSVLVSLIIGMLAGVIPAYQASKLRPVDALRRE
jgi:putative ABC transport system permease protein